MCRLIELMIAAILLSSCTGADQPESRNNEVRNANSHSLECNFSTGPAPGPFCRVSIFALLADPERLDGKSIFTYGFLIKDSEGHFGLYPDSNFRAVPDVISCVRIESFARGQNQGELSGLETLRFYSVALGGRFKKTSGLPCEGILTDVEIVALNPRADRQ